jgi:hypothetical protein
VGNDLLDLLRDEDRPSLSQLPDGQIVEVAPWFVTYEPPAARDSLRIHSQLYLRLSQAYSSLVGITLSRAWMIYEGVRGEGYGPADVLSYVRDFNKVKHLHGGAVAQSVGPAALLPALPASARDRLEAQCGRPRPLRPRSRPRTVRRSCSPPIPTKLGIEPGDVGPLVDALAAALPSLSPERLRDNDDAYYERLLRQLEKRGLPVLDLRPALRAAAADDRVFYRSDFHSTCVATRSWAMRSRSGSTRIAPSSCRPAMQQKVKGYDRNDVTCDRPRPPGRCTGDRGARAPRRGGRIPAGRGRHRYETRR